MGFFSVNWHLSLKNESISLYILIESLTEVIASRCFPVKFNARVNLVSDFFLNLYRYIRNIVLEINLMNHNTDGRSNFGRYATSLK